MPISKESKIYIAGHKGFVGSSLLEDMKNKGYSNIVTKTRQELDLINQQAVEDFISNTKPAYVVICAAKVGGIIPNNTRPAEFLYDNLQTATNLIHFSYKHKVKKLIFLGSSCIYPKEAQQPIKEEYLLTGKLESTNYAYAVAKSAAIKMCEAYNTQYGTNFVSLNPSNLYGPNDNFDELNSHMIAALIRKIHLAKINKESSITLWGTGTPLRECLYVKDFVDIIENVLSRDDIDDEIINIGTQIDYSITDIAKTIMRALDYECTIEYDTSKPDGTKRKLIDTSRMEKYGLKAKTDLENGIRETYEWFVTNDIT